MAGLAVIGISLENTLILSIFFGLMLIVIALLGGLRWLLSTGDRVSNGDHLELQDELLRSESSSSE